MPINSRRALIQSVAQIAVKKLDEIINERCKDRCKDRVYTPERIISPRYIAELFTDIVDQLKDNEGVKSQLNASKLAAIQLPFYHYSIVPHPPGPNCDSKSVYRCYRQGNKIPLTDILKYYEIPNCIIELLPGILNQITDGEIEAQLKIYVKSDPYNSDNGLPLPYFKTAFNLPPPRQYNSNHLSQFMVGSGCTSFKQKCIEMRTGRWVPMDGEKSSILPSEVAKKVYELFHPYTGRINHRKTGLPIQTESNAHRKHLNEFQLKYRSMNEKLTAITVEEPKMKRQKKC